MQSKPGRTDDTDLAEDKDRGEISEEGFKDYDKEFHPADVKNRPDRHDDSDSDEPSGNQ